MTYLGLALFAAGCACLAVGAAVEVLLRRRVPLALPAGPLGALAGSSLVVAASGLELVGGAGGHAVLDDTRRLIEQRARTLLANLDGTVSQGDGAAVPEKVPEMSPGG